MSGSVPCTAAHSPRSTHFHLRRWCARLASQTRPELPFLYPFLSKRHKSKVSYHKNRVSRLPPRPRRDSFVRKFPFDPAAKAGFFEKTHSQLDDAIAALRAYQQDNGALQESLRKASESFRAGRPEAPLFRPLEHMKRRRKRLERKIYDKSRLPALHFNPWANILADRLRMCPATGVRFPVTLLTGFGLVRHPENRNDVYLLPTELADLDKLEHLGDRVVAQRTRDKEKFTAGTAQGRPAEDGFSLFSEEPTSSDSELTSPFFPGQRNRERMVMGPGGSRVNALETLEQKMDRLTKSNPPPSQTETPTNPIPTRMLPHLNLFRQMTLKMTKLRGNQLDTSVNQPQRLLPQSLKARLQDLAHYVKLRQRAEWEAGVVSRTGVPKEAELDIATIKWQGDITARLLTLMRERVVLVTQRILELESTKVRRKRLQIWSDDLLRDSFARFEIEQSPEPVSAPAHANLSDTQPPEGSPKTPDTRQRQREFQRDRSEALRTVQTRLYLHFGPYPTPLLDDLTTTVTGSPCNPDTEHYLPPMLPGSAAASAQHAFPFIPMLPLLGAERHAKLRSAILQRVKQGQLTVFGEIATPGESAQSDVEQQQEQEQQPFTLVIKASAWHANTVFGEVWQLWRYVGGRAALAMWEAGIDVADEEVVGDPRRVAAMGLVPVSARGVQGVEEMEEEWEGGDAVEEEGGVAKETEMVMEREDSAEKVRKMVKKGDLSTLFDVQEGR